MRFDPRRSSAAVMLLGAVLGVTSCAPGDRPVDFTTRAFERTIEDCQQRPSPCAKLSLSYPEITRARTEQVRDSLNHGILRPILQSIDIKGSKASPQELAEELFFYYDRVVKEFPDYAAQWYIERSARIVLDTLGILSVQYSDHLYTGGAHPLEQELYRLFDTRSGSPITVDSLLARGGKERLLALAEREFRRVRGIPPERSLNSEGFWFRSSRFLLAPNIGLSSRGLELAYNPYEIAPYAMGSTHLVLPYDSLEGVLDLARRGG